MEIVLRKYGNSTVAVLPPPVLKDLGLAAGQAMTLDTTPDGRIVLARKRKYRAKWTPEQWAAHRERALRNYYERKARRLAQQAVKDPAQDD